MRTRVSSVGLPLLSALLVVVLLGSAFAAEKLRATTIQGVAWHADNTPLRHAKLRLRNIVNGRIQAGTVANEEGIFTFTGMLPGAYLVELVNDEGQVLAVGHAFALADGETVATFVRLPAKAPWFQGFFANAAPLIAIAAASTGITAIAPETVPPVSAAR